MKKKSETEVREFPITSAEFTGTIRQPESRKAFEYLCKVEELGGHKTFSEWQSLFEMFQSKPMNITWSEWTADKGGE